MEASELATREALLRTARRVFLGSLVYTAGLTLLWAAIIVVRPQRIPIFKSYAVEPRALFGPLFYFLFFVLLWGFIWYGIRLLLLRKFVKMSKEDAVGVFDSRMRRPFELARYLERYSERRIRITDMIGRRGRFLTLALLFFSAGYVGVLRDQNAQAFVLGFSESLLGTAIGGWLNLAFYYSDGLVARAVFGPQSRVMDGVLGRANCLIISTLWNAFAFVMVPIAGVLAAHFPKEALAPAFVFIWFSYITADGLSEIVGSLFGRQKLRVWGIGEVNKKSVEGTVAAFGGSLAICLAVVAAMDLPSAWMGLAVVVSVSNTLLELFSPRGTDDFTMATANALLCAAFGALYY
jgi:dolichol kinase